MGVGVKDSRHDTRKTKSEGDESSGFWGQKACEKSESVETPKGVVGEGIGFWCKKSGGGRLPHSSQKPISPKGQGSVEGCRLWKEKVRGKLERVISDQIASATAERGGKKQQVPGGTPVARGRGSFVQVGWKKGRRLGGLDVLPNGCANEKGGKRTTEPG